MPAASHWLVSCAALLVAAYLIPLPLPLLPPAHPQFRNEELHRLQEVAPGTSYRVLTTVLTTAMHGEKFR